MSDYITRLLLRFEEIDILKKNPSALGHEFVDGDLWITAPTKKLQSFFLKHLNTKDALSAPEEYVRKR